MSTKSKRGKRKATPVIEDKKAITEKVVESEDESEDEEILLNGAENQDNDSTDDEGVDELFTSDDDDDLSFVSDEEGNFKHVEKVSEESGEGSEIEDDDDEGEGSESSSEDEGGDSDDEEEEDADEVSDKEQPTTSAKNEKVNGNAKEKSKPKSKSPKALKRFQDQLKADSGPSAAAKSGIYDEYEEIDTSDEEDIRNTVGNIPLNWYDEYKHIGYDWEAKKIIKPPEGDQIDDFLKKIEDPNFWRTVKDPQTGQQVLLSDADIELIKRINSGRIPDGSYNQYEPWIEWFTNEVEKMPIKNIPEHKRSFLPSQGDKKAISRMVHALKMGWMKTARELKKEREKNRGPKFYMLWETDTDREDIRRIHDHVAAPKRDLPGHAESYNPPPEYLFDEKEMREWNKMRDEPHKRKLHFLPQKYKSLREVPAYDRYARERFLRCLDLYLCPRARRIKLNIDADYLVPKLPSPKDLQPFPTVESLVYRGHSDLVRSVSVEPKGEYMVSGSDDMTVKIWEVSTGRCLRTIETDDIVRCVAWCPNPKLSLIVVSSGSRVLLINTKVGDRVLVKKTDDLLAEAPTSDLIESDRIKTAVQWGAPTKEEYEAGIRIVLTHFKPVRQVTWHGRGDYFATVMPEGANRSALIHQLSKRRTQIPFSKSKGLIQCVLFHPVKPCFFVATQHNIRIYDLVKQELIKKLLTASKWISNMAIHPKGDNLLVSTYDKKMLWFDLDLSTKPYQTMRLHKNAVRCVAYHLRYPLFASGSDDRAIIVSHGMVYNDLLQNPLIVPLKKLETHEARQEFGVLDVVWHPMQPWVFSSGADTTIRLYT